MHESNLFATGLGCSAVAIKYICRLSGVKVLDRLVKQLIKDLRVGGLVDFVPVNVLGRLRVGVEDDPAVLGRAARVLARVYRKGVSVLGLGDDAFLVGDFVVKELLVRQIAVNGLGPGDA